ncbi:MAG TPA: universal stress protein [Candidatus Binatia bacterium]|nr:universal stress protein [Candidatus Binatia bacterium]
MLKSILVALDGSEHSRSATECGLWMGQRLNASVTALHVIDIVSIEGSFLHDISGSLGFEPYLDFSSKMREVLEERGRAMLGEFAERAKEAGVRYETVMDVGVIANEICERARTADVVVIGHRGINEKFSTGLLGGTAESVTRKCTKPLLVCPVEWKAPERPLLAYDGSQRSASAMQTAADFCASLSLPLGVVHVARDEASAHRVLEEAKRYLSSYSIQTSFSALSGHAPEQIVAKIRSEAHDLLFIGAYGHSRIVEMVIGSTTEYVLRNAPCPVFLHR